MFRFFEDRDGGHGGIFFRGMDWGGAIHRFFEADSSQAVRMGGVNGEGGFLVDCGALGAEGFDEVSSAGAGIMSVLRRTTVFLQTGREFLFRFAVVGVLCSFLRLCRFCLRVQNALIKTMCKEKR